MKTNFFDVLVEMRKTGGVNGNSAFGFIPIGRTYRGFLEQSCLDSEGNLKIGERIEVRDKLSTSNLQSMDPTQDPNLFNLTTNTGKYQMRVIRKNKLRHSI